MPTESNTEAAAPVTVTNNKKSNKKLFLILGGCGCLLLLACAALFGGLILLGVSKTNEVQKPANTLFEEVRNGNVDKAYDSTSKGFKNAMTKTAWKEFVKTQKLETNRNPKWTETKINTDTAILNGSIEISGSKEELTLNLVKENDKWVVNGFQFK